jgi:hypothetical protein
MAAFCGCCGAEITRKTTDACPMCGAPRHGLLREEPLWVAETEKDFSTKEAHGIRSDHKCLKSKQTTHDRAGEHLPQMRIEK